MLLWRKNKKVIKILFLVNKGSAGGDIYFNRLSAALEVLSDFQVELKYFPRYFEILPFLAYFYIRFHHKKIQQFDIIHANAEFGCYVKVSNIPLIVTIHHLVIEEAYKRYTSLVQKIFYSVVLKPHLKRTFQKADSIIAVSNYTKREVLKYFDIDPDKISVIHNGIDPELYKPSRVDSHDATRFRLLFTGNLTKRKGADLLTIIMKKLGNRFQLFVTGGLRESKFKNTDNIVMLGKLSESDLIKEYNKCDALLFPTRLEGFGYSVLEAMSCGKPVITTDCSSIPELIEDGKNGFLCQTDDVVEFVEKVKILANDINLRNRMQEENRKRVIEKFNLEKMRIEYESLYEKII